MYDFREERIIQNIFPGSFVCGVCFRSYSFKSGLSQHQRFECGKDPQFACDYPDCTYKAKRKENLKQHKRLRHSVDSSIKIKLI